MKKFFEVLGGVILAAEIVIWVALLTLAPLALLKMCVLYLMGG